MSIKIAITNSKGGIGKTTTAVCLADCLSKRGYKTILIDTDAQRNASTIYRAEMTDKDHPTLYDMIFSGYTASQCIQHTAMGDIIPSDIALKNADVEIKPSPKMYKYLKNAIQDIESIYDFCIFDCPPSSNTVVGNVLMVCSFLLVPISCDVLGLENIQDFYETVSEFTDDNPSLKILGLLPIKYKKRFNLTNDIENRLLPKYAEQIHTKVFKTRIRESVKVQEAQTLRVRLSDYAPKCTTYLDYENLTDEILEEVL